MKRNILTTLSLVLIFFSASAFTFPPASGGEAVVLIDGKKITPDGVLVFERDDTVYLEASGIKPNSMINIKIKKLGIRWITHEFEIDETGGVKGIMHMPEQKIKVTCIADYYSADGSFHEVKFQFKTR